MKARLSKRGVVDFYQTRRKAATIAAANPQAVFMVSPPLVYTWYIAGIDTWTTTIKMNSCPTSSFVTFERTELKAISPKAPEQPARTANHHFEPEIFSPLYIPKGKTDSSTMTAKNVTDVPPFKLLLFMKRGHSPKSIPARTIFKVESFIQPPAKPLL